MTNYLLTNIQKFYTMVLFLTFITFGQTVAQGQTESLPCLPSHGGDGDVSAWCGEETITQTIPLSSGWNWFSSYVEADDLLEQLEESLGENGLVIASSLFTTEYDDGEWFGDLDSEGITNSEMYMILTDGEVTVQMQGTPATPSSHPITINPGWNWVGFPCSEEMDVVDALANFEAEEEDALATPDGIIEFDGEEWFGDFDTMIPGKGYMYFSNSTVTKIVYILTSSRTRNINKRH